MTFCAPAYGGMMTPMGAGACEWCGGAFTWRGTSPRRFCTRACADAWTQRDKPTAEWLRAKYWDEGLTAVEIGALVQRHPKRVWEWLKQANIETRPRGSYKYSLGKPSPHRGRKHTPEAIARITAARRRVPREAYANNGSYLKARAGDKHPNWQGGVTPERQAFYSSPEWKRAAQAVWARDKGVCQRCGAAAERTKDAHSRWHIHHIVSFRVRELRTVLTNLVLLCPTCHRWVHSRANTEKVLLG